MQGSGQGVGQSSSYQAGPDQNAIIGISGGMVRLKGNSPKVSSKDSQNRPRNIKNFGGQGGVSAGIGTVGSIG